MHYDLKQLSALNEAVKVVEEARSVKDISSSELMGSHLKLKELIKNKKASEAQIERSKEIERELGNRSAAAIKKAKSSPEYRKRMMAEEVEELEEAKQLDPEKWVAVYRQPKGKDQYWMETRSANSYASRSLNKAKLFDSKEEAEKFAKSKSTIGPEFVGAKQIKSITESANYKEHSK